MIKNGGERGCAAAELYLVSGAERADELELLRRAAAGGLTRFQLRAKGIGEEELLPRAERLAALCAEISLPLIINDHPRLARRVGAAGVHLGQDDGPIDGARQVLGAGFLVGRSVHSLAEAQQAQAEGADYIAVGSVFPTASKPGRRPCGLETARQVADAVSVPLFAIGGIDLLNVGGLIAAGIRRVAVISLLWSAPDPALVAAKMMGLLRGPAR